MSATNRDENSTVVRGLGEISLRIHNLETMQKFYGEVMGLTSITRAQDYAFFKIADGYAGHSQVLALFDPLAKQQPGCTPPNSSCGTTFP